jgi:RimJ/RimL family protein N-acetyltransferase
MMKRRMTPVRLIEPEDRVFLRELPNDRAVAISAFEWALPRSDHRQSKWRDAAVEDPSIRRFVIVGKNGTTVGLTGLWDIGWRSRHALTAVKLHPEQVTGKRTATDAIRILVACALCDVGLHRLWSGILVFNGALMGAYVENCGWRMEGVLREHAMRRGRYRSACRVAALKAGFDGLKDAQDYLNRILPVDTNGTTDIRPGWWAPGIAPV